MVGGGVEKMSPQVQEPSVFVFTLCRWAEENFFKKMFLLNLCMFKTISASGESF